MSYKIGCILFSIFGLPLSQPRRKHLTTNVIIRRKALCQVNQEVARIPKNGNRGRHPEFEIAIEVEIAFVAIDGNHEGTQRDGKSVARTEIEGNATLGVSLSTRVWENIR